MDESQFQIDNELSTRLFELCTLEAHTFGSPRHSFETIFEFLGRLVLNLLSERPFEVFEIFTIPTFRADNHVVRLRVLDSFRFNLTLAALNRFGAHTVNPSIINSLDNSTLIFGNPPNRMTSDFLNTPLPTLMTKQVINTHSSLI